MRNITSSTSEHARLSQCLETDSLRARARFGSDSGNAFNPPSRSRVQTYAPVMAELTDRMLESWISGKSVWIDKEFEVLTSQIALKTLFDLDDPGDRDRFGEALHLAFDLMTARLRQIFKLPLWIPTPTNLRLQWAIAELDRTVQDFIASGRSRREAGEDLLSRLLLAQHEDGTRMSDRLLRDEAMQGMRRRHRR